MIDTQYGKLVIECDSCDAVFTGASDDWKEDVWPAAKRDGWHSAKIAEVWLHGCPHCGRPT